MSGQHKIHRHRQEVLNHQRSVGNDNTFSNDVNESHLPSTAAISFTCGVSPAIAAAAVRAAPSPNHHLNKLTASIQFEAASQQRRSDPAALAPFSSFNSITKNNDNNVAVMHQSQTMTSAAIMSNNVSMYANQNYQQVFYNE